MILKEDIHLKDLCGLHKFQGIEVVTLPKTNYRCYCQVVRIMLDGTTFELMEDPDDGYRSYCDDIIISDDTPRYTFPDYEILCKMKPDDRFDKHDVLIAEDPNTGLTIFEIGTLYVDDYHPCWHFEYHPENMYYNNFDMALDDYIEFKMEEARLEAIETFNNYKRNSDYLFDLLFCYNMDYKERDELYKTLLSIGYKKEDIRDIIFGQLPERSVENEI